VKTLESARNISYSKSIVQNSTLFLGVPIGTGVSLDETIDLRNFVTLLCVSLLFASNQL
jgi:hypothetical protein